MSLVALMLFDPGLTGGSADVALLHGVPAHPSCGTGLLMTLNVIVVVSNNSDGLLLASCQALC